MIRLLAVIFLTVYAVAAEEVTTAPKIEISSTRVTHGSILVVKVSDKTAKRVQIKKSIFPLFDGVVTWQKGILLGVPSWWDVGEKYEVEVDGVKTGLFVEVDGRTAKSEKIDIEKSKLVTNEQTKKQGELLVKAIATETGKRFWNGNFIKPVEGRVSTEYGTGRTVNGNQGGMHRGLDIAADEGTEIKAANDGVVVLSRNHILTGNTIVLNHGQGVISVYYHMSALVAKEGEEVKKGEVIGKVGSTGVSTGAHLHWGIWIFGVDVNPIELIEKNIEF